LFLLDSHLDLLCRIAKLVDLALMDVQHAVITGGGGSLAAAMMRAMSAPLWQLEAPTRSELDVTDAAAVDSYFKDRPIDLLVCAAGAVADAPLARMGEESWDHIFAVNYQGAADCAAAVLPTMLRQQRGHIILISSHSALHPPTGQAAYASAKAALLGLNATLARRYGRHNIRVNTLLPGFIETRITEAVSVSRKAEILEKHALGRLNDAAAVARFVAFLHTDLPHTSGQVFQLDSRPT
jgi:3-oxoacyl-[acyl-carrier protein] reductase